MPPALAPAPAAPPPASPREADTAPTAAPPGALLRQQAAERANTAAQGTAAAPAAGDPGAAPPAVVSTPAAPAAPAAAKAERAVRDDAQAARDTARLAGAAPARAAAPAMPAAPRNEVADLARSIAQPPLRALLAAVNSPGSPGLAWQGPGMSAPTLPEARAREWLQSLAAATTDKWAPASVETLAAEGGATAVLWLDAQGLWVQVVITAQQARWLPRDGPAWVAPLSAAESLRLRTP